MFKYRPLLLNFRCINNAVCSYSRYYSTSIPTLGSNNNENKINNKSYKYNTIYGIRPKHKYFNLVKFNNNNNKSNFSTTGNSGSDKEDILNLIKGDGNDADDIFSNLNFNADNEKDDVYANTVLDNFLQATEHHTVDPNLADDIESPEQGEEAECYDRGEFPGIRQTRAASLIDTPATRELYSFIEEMYYVNMATNSMGTVMSKDGSFKNLGHVDVDGIPMEPTPGLDLDGLDTDESDGEVDNLDDIEEEEEIEGDFADLEAEAKNMEEEEEEAEADDEEESEPLTFQQEAAELLSYFTARKLKQQNKMLKYAKWINKIKILKAQKRETKQETVAIESRKSTKLHYPDMMFAEDLLSYLSDPELKHHQNPELVEFYARGISLNPTWEPEEKVLFIQKIYKLLNEKNIMATDIKKDISDYILEEGYTARSGEGLAGISQYGPQRLTHSLPDSVIESKRMLVSFGGQTGEGEEGEYEYEYELDYAPDS